MLPIFRVPVIAGNTVLNGVPTFERGAEYAIPAPELVVLTTCTRTNFEASLEVRAYVLEVAPEMSAHVYPSDELCH